MVGTGLRRLTWKGPEFLDDIREPEIWISTKARSRGIASIGIGFVWEVAKAEVKAKLGLSQIHLLLSSQGSKI
jgi:hypothetical protein